MTKLAQYRAFFIVVLSVLAPLFYGHWFQISGPWFQNPKLTWLLLFVGSMILLALAAWVPERYAKVHQVQMILPAIHRVLNLTESDRVTMHHLKSKRLEKYEQLVNYFPAKFGGRGRFFRFSHGIVGERFKKMGADYYSIPRLARRAYPASELEQF